MDMIQVRHTLSSASLPSITEFSEPLSEADEIESVLHLQRVGDEAFKRNNYHQAVSFFTDALEIDEENAQLLSRRAIANFHLLNYKQALRDAETVVKFNPHVAKGHQLLAMCYQKLNRLKPALSSYLRAIQLDDQQSSKLVSRLVHVASGLCNVENLAVDQESTLSDQLMAIGKSLRDAHQPKTSCEVFRVVISLKSLVDTQRLEALFLLGCGYRETKEYERALEYFRQCLSVLLSSAQTCYALKCYLQMVKVSFSTHNFEMGIVYAQNIITLCEDGLVVPPAGEFSVDVLDTLDITQQMEESLILAYRALGNMDTALHHAQRFVDKVDKQGQNLEVITKAHWLLGLLEEANCQFPEALESYQRFLKFSKQKNDRGSIARAYGCLGKIHHKLKNFALAGTFYEQQMHLSEKLQYHMMLAPVLKNLSDLHQDLGDDEATIKYLGMYLRVSCKLDEFETECRAFVAYGDFYHKCKECYLACHYYEEAVKLAQRSEEKEMEILASLKLARVLVDGAQTSESITKALSLIKAARTHFEEVALAREKEGGLVSAEAKACIKECFELHQIALYSLNLHVEALVVSEEYRMKQIQGLPNNQNLYQNNPKFAFDRTDLTTKTGMEALKRHVSTIGHPVLCLSTVEMGVFGWLMTPGSCDVHYHFQQITDKCHEELIRSILSNLRNLESVEYDIECRTLPFSNSGGHKDMKDGLKIQGRPLQPKKETASESETADKNSMSYGNTDKNDLQPLEDLYSLLLDPFVGLLQEYTSLTVVVDNLLLQVPFDCLVSRVGEDTNEPLRVNLIPSLQFLLHQKHPQKHPQMSETSPKEKSGGNNQSMDSRSPRTVYLDQLLRVAVRSVDKPHQPIRNSVKDPPIVATDCPNPSLIAFNLSSHHEVRVKRDILNEMESRKLLHSNAKGSTLITNSWNGDEVPSSTEGAIHEYKHSQPAADILVMGNPKLPSELQWHNKVWRPATDMVGAQTEVHKIGNQLNTTPCIGSAMTRREVMKRLPSAMIVHVATYGSWCDGVFVCSPDPITSKDYEGPLPMAQCLVTCDDILQLRLVADLVVLNLGYGHHHRELSMQLPLAFLEAGVKSVLLPQWAVCIPAQDRFWSSFYTSLHDGVHVTEALKKAKAHVRSDTRFAHPRYWAGYCLLGNDPLIDLSKMKSAAFDHRLNLTEQDVLSGLRTEMLNLSSGRDKDPSIEGLTTRLGHHLSELLLQHQDNKDVIPAVLEVMEVYCTFSQIKDKKTPPLRQIHPCIATSPSAINLLTLVGFHFQPSGVDPDGPPLAIYPQWDPDELKGPTLQSLHGIAFTCDIPECSLALSEVLNQTPAVFSSLIDVLAITKHMPDIHLRLSDYGVAEVWNRKVARDLLSTIGFYAVGTLLGYKRSTQNLNSLSAILSVFCALGGEKGRAMLHQVDPKHLGLANRQVFRKSPSRTPIKLSRIGRSSVLISPKIPAEHTKQLPSLNPVMANDNKMTFSTPWRSLPENAKEQREKIRVARSLEAVHREGRENARMTNEWHRLCTHQQSSQTLNQLGQVKEQPRKVKVHPGGSLTSLRVPVGYRPPLPLGAIEQRRDYAHYILSERQADVTRRHDKAVREVFLPYVKS